MRRYLLFVAVANLVWETLHLPLYTIWQEGAAGELAFAVVHCTGGDILMALSSLMLALVRVGSGNWPGQRYVRAAPIAIAFGLAYKMFSGWLKLLETGRVSCRGRVCQDVLIQEVDVSVKQKNT